jgi:hypothetical protein
MNDRRETGPEFPDGPPIPEMREALLNAGNVRDLVADLRECTQIISLQCKANMRSQQAFDGERDLGFAMEQLLAREFHALQIRYGFDGFEWTDTLLQTQEGVRLVRCRH